MIGLNLVIKVIIFIFTIEVFCLSFFIFLSLIYDPRPWLWRLFSILQREREKASNLCSRSVPYCTIYYWRSANTLEINFPLPREIISTISSFTHIGHHTIVALGLIIWRSSITRRMFSTIETLDRDRAIYSSGSGSVKQKFTIFFPLKKLYFGMS